MFEEAFDFLKRGGPIMVPIALCSLVALALFLERVWYLQRSRILPPHFLAVVSPYITDRRWDDVRRLCDSSQSAIAGIIRSSLPYVGQPRTAIRESMEESGRRVAGRLARYLGAIGAIASVTPLLGLLGTVTGMIDVFQEVDDTVRATGEVQPGVLASGIWEALMTTAAGLSVAIPTFVGFKYLEGRIDRLVSELEERADHFATFMIRKSDIGNIDPPSNREKRGAKASTANSAASERSPSRGSASSAGASDGADDDDEPSGQDAS